MGIADIFKKLLSKTTREDSTTHITKRKAKKVNGFNVVALSRKSKGELILSIVDDGRVTSCWVELHGNATGLYVRAEIQGRTGMIYYKVDSAKTADDLLHNISNWFTQQYKKHQDELQNVKAPALSEEQPMSIHSISRKLAIAGVQHVVVSAEAEGDYDRIALRKKLLELRSAAKDWSTKPQGINEVQTKCSEISKLLRHVESDSPSSKGRRTSLSVHCLPSPSHCSVALIRSLQAKKTRPLSTSSKPSTRWNRSISVTWTKSNPLVISPLLLDQLWTPSTTISTSI